MAKKRLLKEMPNTAFALVLAGGMLILIGGFVMEMLTVALPFAGMMMGGIQYLSIGWSAAAVFIGIICGITVIISAVIMRTRDANRLLTWAIIALVASAVSLVGGGGLVIGFVLALAGSVIGLMQSSNS